MCDFLAAVCQYLDHEGTKEVLVHFTVHLRAVIDLHEHAVSFKQLEDAPQVAAAPPLGVIGDADKPTVKTVMSFSACSRDRKRSVVWCGVPGALHQLDGLGVVPLCALHDLMLEVVAVLQVSDLGEDVIVSVLLDVQAVVLVFQTLHEPGEAVGPPVQDAVPAGRGRSYYTNTPRRHAGTSCGAFSNIMADAYEEKCFINTLKVKEVEGFHTLQKCCRFALSFGRLCRQSFIDVC